MAARSRGDLGTGGIMFRDKLVQAGFGRSRGHTVSEVEGWPGCNRCQLRRDMPKEMGRCCDAKLAGCQDSQSSLRAFLTCSS